MPPSPPERATAPALLADLLRDEVLSGRLGPGTPLREEDIATRTGHARHTVRAALARLVDERVAVSEPYRGVRVTAFDDADVVALQQLRGALESEAVRLLGGQHGPRWPRAVLAPVREALDALAAEPDDDWPAVARAHASVHRTLVAAAGSPRITAAHDRLDAELLLVLVQVRPAYTVAGLVREHRSYLAAVQRDGPDAVRRHLAHSTRLILDARAGAG
ncbi:GntR family transcriptional regulator [Nocardioides litoris]|uniref:GntR family transcriptional regulator n=1 Tax=Nocardioides litoris TaxID=1926648 RepID=UPI001120B966|nr:GntR family transcriptional regulator [Nocardioides litoris]